MIVFKTETGSVYQLDRENMRFRRVEGLTDPTPRVGQDGVWRECSEASDPEVGKSAVIIWKFEFDPEDHPGELIARTTITSRVTEVR